MRSIAVVTSDSDRSLLMTHQRTLQLCRIPMQPLSQEQWSVEARTSCGLPEVCELRPFQTECANIVIGQARLRDRAYRIRQIIAVVPTLTGSKTRNIVGDYTVHKFRCGERDTVSYYNPNCTIRVLTKFTERMSLTFHLPLFIPKIKMYRMLHGETIASSTFV
jgi:hypothetical protein